MKIANELRTVLWGLIGLGERNRDEPPKGNPLVVIAVAFVLVGLFLGTLVFVARHAASGG
jgi:hypothetical protein